MPVHAKVELKVHLAFDEEAKVWYVAESDIPGLRLEADDPLDLVRRISDAMPELVALNCDEILKKHAPKKRAPVVFTPVFDNPLQVPAFA